MGHYLRAVEARVLREQVLAKRPGWCLGIRYFQSSALLGAAIEVLHVFTYRVRVEIQSALLR